MYNISITTEDLKSGTEPTKAAQYLAFVSEMLSVYCGNLTVLYWYRIVAYFIIHAYPVHVFITVNGHSDTFL